MGCVLGEDGFVTDMKKMTKAKAKIVLAVPKQMNIYRVQEVRNKHGKIWQTRSRIRDLQKVGLLRTLTLTKLQDCNSIEEYVNVITTTAHTLKELDVEGEIKEEMVGALLLSGLPEEYKLMIIGLESSGTPITSNAKLLQVVKYTGGKQSVDYGSSSIFQGRNDT